MGVKCGQNGMKDGCNESHVLIRLKCILKPIQSRLAWGRGFLLLRNMLRCYLLVPKLVLQRAGSLYKASAMFQFFPFLSACDTPLWSPS